MKIGYLKEQNNIVIENGSIENPNILISETLDLVLYNDITSIENWDKYKSYTNIETLRLGISSLFESIGWDSMSIEEKRISSKWFCVDKSFRDEVHTDDEQKNNINNLILKQERSKSNDYSNVFNSSKTDVDKYLSQVKKSNYIKSLDLTKNINGTVSTTSNEFIDMERILFSEVSMGSYFLNFNCNISGPNTGIITTAIYVNENIISGSENIWESNDSPGRGDSINRNTHSYINFPITIDSLSSISIKWKTELGIARASSLTFSLIKL